MRIRFSLILAAVLSLSILSLAKGRDQDDSKQIDSSILKQNIETLTKENNAKAATIDALESKLLHSQLMLQKSSVDAAVAVQKAGETDKAFALKSSLWPRGRPIRIFWENPRDEHTKYREIVKKAIERTWQKESGLEFSEWSEAKADSEGGIRIAIMDDANQAPHCKRLGRHLNGLKDGMVLNFTFEKWCPQCRTMLDLQTAIENVAIHEFGHAIGLAHEQNRNDAPGWCHKESQGTDGDYQVTVYDPESIMNYCNPKWNNNGKLSPLDIEGVRKLYGPPKSRK